MSRKEMLKRRRSNGVENFDLLIWRTPEGYHARFRDPKRGKEAHADFTNPFASPEIRQALLETASGCRDLKPSQPQARDLARDLGSRLFEAVFARSVLVAWHRHLDEAEEKGRDLRLRIHLHSEAPELWDWPWELLYDPGRGFLAVVPGTPLVRYVEKAAPPRPLRVRLPLKVLAVTASPRGLSPLHAEEELADLEKALEDVRAANWVEIERLENVTREKIRQKLLEKDFHVLHFIGHGTFDADRGGSVLFLEREDGSPDPLGGLELSVLLQAQPRLQLILLNACQGARGSGSDPFAGLALSLVQARFPAVIAMRSAVTDRAAVAFARDFYRSLARREPVDQGVSQGRQAMLAMDSGEWGSPVLAMRSPDGVIIKPPLWDVFLERMVGILSRWRYAFVALLLLTLLFLGFWGLGKRWIDPNFLYAFFNPPDCPSPSGLPIAFVKVEPSGGRPFCMSRYEVSQHLYRKVNGKIRSRRRGDALPIVRVSWQDAMAFLAGLERRSPGGRFRLPARSDWRSAAGNVNTLKASAATANCENKENNDGYEGTAPVGSFPPNFWGLHDMAGNVAEWGSEADGEKRIVRGGSFQNALRNCSVSYWTRAKPDGHYDDVGFRIIRDPIPPK